jgi:hypothetical protein
MWAKLERGQAKDAKRAEKQQRWLERREQGTKDTKQTGRLGSQLAEDEAKACSDRLDALPTAY